MLGCAFLATSGSLKHIFLKLLAVGFIPSVDNLVVQALRKGPFSTDTDEEWQVQLAYRALPKDLRNVFFNVLVPMGLGRLCLCLLISHELPDHFGGSSRGGGERIIRANLCRKKAPCTSLPNSRSADVILLISISLQHATTMLDDVTQLRQHVACNNMHSTKAKSISNATPKPRNSKTATAQGTKICILPPDGKIEYIDELITFKNALQVELDHLIECAWATFTSHRQELTSPTYPLRE